MGLPDTMPCMTQHAIPCHRDGATRQHYMHDRCHRDGATRHRDSSGTSVASLVHTTACCLKYSITMPQGHHHCALSTAWPPRRVGQIPSTVHAPLLVCATLHSTHCTSYSMAVAVRAAVNCIRLTVSDMPDRPGGLRVGLGLGLGL